MTHRAGQITAAIVQTLQASTQLLVPLILQDREMSLSEDAGELPCVCVNEGDDDALSDEGNDNLGFIDSEISFEITGYAVGTSEPEVKAELRRQRRYIHVALLAYLTAGNPIGLAFVSAIKYSGADKAVISVTGEVTAGSIVSRWRVQYRMNVLDPGD